MSKKAVSNRAPGTPPANDEGSFGQPGMVWDHHPPGCSCRRCRRLTIAARRRRRKQIQRDFTREEGDGD